MSEAFITTLRESLRLPSDIRLDLVVTNSEYNYVLLTIGIAEDEIPAVVSFRPLQMDLFSASYRDKLEQLLEIQDSSIGYNVALSIPLPYHDFKGNEDKIRRIVRRHSKL